MTDTCTVIDNVPVNLTIIEPEVITLTVGIQGATGAKGDTGNQGIQGVQGIQGIQGVQGNPGQSINHVSLTSGTSLPGTTDTYTVWGDMGETVNLGTFNIYNGADSLGNVTQDDVIAMAVAL